MLSLWREETVTGHGPGSRMFDSDHQPGDGRLNSYAITSQPGTYVLVLNASKPRRVEVGRLGQLAVREGCYIYVGTAFGPGGLRARIGHHLRLARHPHWHIDYLRRVVRLVEVWYSRDAVRWEHDWARVFLSMPGSSVPLRRFGATDCTCDTHLFFFEAAPAFKDFRRRTRAAMQALAVVGRTRGEKGAPLGALPAGEHGRERPAIEGRLDAGDLPVFHLVPLRDQSRSGGRGFGLQLEEDGGIVPFRNDPLRIQPDHDL